MFSCTEGFFFPPRFGLHTLAIHTSWMSLSVCAQLAEGTVTFLSDPAETTAPLPSKWLTVKHTVHSLSPWSLLPFKIMIGLCMVIINTNKIRGC